MADALASVSRDGDAEALAAAVRAALADDGLGQEDIFQARKLNYYISSPLNKYVV